MAAAGRRPFRVCTLPQGLLATLQLCSHLREHSLVPAAGCLPRRLLLERLLSRSVVANPQLRHRLFQCGPMTVGNSLSWRYWLDVRRCLGRCGLISVLLNTLLRSRCFLQLLHALLRSCCGLLHLLNALLCSVSFLQALSGSFGLLDALLRPPQRSLRLPVIARAPAA